MYFRPSQFPMMKGSSKSEQLRVLIEAINKYGKPCIRRWWIAVAAWFCCAALSYFGFLQILNEYDALLAYIGSTLVYGIIFYVYLLWEVNGTIFKAVERYFD